MKSVMMWLAMHRKVKMRADKKGMDSRIDVMYAAAGMMKAFLRGETILESTFSGQVPEE
jgi:hypothetical protein